MCETPKDAQALYEAYNALYEAEMLWEWPEGLQVITLPTPKKNGVYTVIPYSNKINWALDRIGYGDAVVYLDNGSMPGEDKFEAMLAALEDYGAVYCTQRRTGYNEDVNVAEHVVTDAYCVLNYTQVMHRYTTDRWPTDMSYARPNDLADATFWRYLHVTLGDFHPVGPKVHDEHHIPSPTAQGLE